MDYNNISAAITTSKSSACVDFESGGGGVEGNDFFSLTRVFAVFVCRPFAMVFFYFSKQCGPCSLMAPVALAMSRILSLFVNFVKSNAIK